MESMATDTYRTFHIFMTLMTYVRQRVHINISLKNFVKRLADYFALKL